MQPAAQYLPSRQLDGITQSLVSNCYRRQGLIVIPSLLPIAEGDQLPQPHCGFVVRQTACRSILNRSALGGYCLNCYTGCTHGCVYCYARFMQRFHPHEEPWGDFVDVKINAVEVLKRQLRRAEPGEVFISSACDGWQPIECQYQLTRRCCQLLLEHGFSLFVLTKSKVVLRDMDVFRQVAPARVTVGVTITTLNERLRALWEPRADSVADRLSILATAKDAKLRTSIMFGPLLPGLSDDHRSLELMMQHARHLAVDKIWVDALNPRPRVWPSVAQLLRRHFPQLLEQYRKVLFDAEFRRQYLAQLRQLVEDVARRQKVARRVSICF